MADQRHILLAAPASQADAMKAEVHAIRPHTLGRGRLCTLDGEDWIAWDTRWRALPVTLPTGEETDAWSLLQQRAPAYGAEIVIIAGPGESGRRVSFGEALAELGLTIKEVSE